MQNPSTNEDIEQQNVEGAIDLDTISKPKETEKTKNQKTSETAEKENQIDVESIANPNCQGKAKLIECFESLL